MYTCIVYVYICMYTNYSLKYYSIKIAAAAAADAAAAVAASLTYRIYRVPPMHRLRPVGRLTA